MTKKEHKHHKVFSRFRRWSGEVRAGFEVDFLGTKSCTSYFTMITPQPSDRREEPGYPPFDEEYFEWIDLLEAAASAKGRFTMLELGGGWGRWTARGAAAATQLGLTYALVAVEAEPTHFSWMEQSLRENGVRMDDCRLIRGAVTGKDGTVGFHVGDPANSYGQSIGGPVKVPAVSLPTLLEPFELVDFVDMDVQGAELEILEAAVDPLRRKVKRVHVETHSRQLHIDIGKLFQVMGWRCHCMFEGNTGDETPWGRINFQGGVQSWVNPALHAQSELRIVPTYRNSVGFRSVENGRRLLDVVAPVGTMRRKAMRALLSGFASRYRRDPQDEARRPVGW
jgi:FkbM family methyltransferase